MMKFKRKKVLAMIICVTMLAFGNLSSASANTASDLVITAACAVRGHVDVKVIYPGRTFFRCVNCGRIR